MEKTVMGTVVSAKKQWWLRINTKAIRLYSGDGAVYPYIIKVAYEAEGKQYTKRKWIRAGRAVPAIGDRVTVVYREAKPAKAKIDCTSTPSDFTS